MTEPVLLDVAPFIQSTERGDSGLAATRSLLGALGRDVAYDDLKALSGDGFRFAYDAAGVYEPLRDLAPIDVIREALSLYGVEASWHIDAPRGEVAALVKGSIERGWPLLTSYLLEEHRTYQLIVGHDLSSAPPRLAVQSGRFEPSADEALRGGEVAADGADDGDEPPRWRRLRDDWSGPLTGRARWATNPVLRIERVAEAPPEWTPAERLTRACQAGLRVFEVFEIPYSTSGEDAALSDGPLAGRAAAHGLSAWGALAEEVAAGGALGYSLVWKLDVLSRRLAHDRACLARFFSAHAPHADEGTRPLIVQLGELCQAVAEQAPALRGHVWSQEGINLGDARQWQRLLASSRALAFALHDEDDAVMDLLSELGYGDRLWQTPRGPALRMDDALRWRALGGVVERLARLETRVEQTLRRVLDA